MKIKILSDSTCDLSKEIVEANDIALIPLTVVKNNEQFKDGITITPDVIFEHVANGGALCTTTANNMGEYAEYFEKYAADYMNLTTGQGLVVLEAVRLAKDATDLDQLADQLRDFSSRVESSFVLDRLDYMVKGGRCSSTAALGANLLNLKPCIEVKDGKMSVVKKYRGNYTKCLTNYVKDRLAEREDVDRGTLFVTRTVVSDESYQAVMEAVEQYGHFDRVYETIAGCTVSCHCGPGTLGVLFVRK